MTRSRLEQASWIAGIVSALAALYLLFFSSPEPPKGGTATSDNVGHATQKTAEIQATPSPSTDTSGLREAIAAAKDIRSLSTRDDEMSRLVRAALQRHEFAVAFEAAREIRVVQ